MNVKRSVASHVIAIAAVAFPCRTAFALEQAAPTNTDTASTEPRAPNQGTTRDTAKQEPKSGGSRRTDHFRVGVLGGVGFPRPLAIEGLVKIENMVGLGVEYSVLPRLSVSGVDTSFYAIAADARVFPFKNAFFVGLRAGRQHLGGAADITVQGYGGLHESMSVDTTFINPRVGLLWTWEPGITLGLDIGVQIPLSSTASSTIPQTALPASVTVDDQIVRVTNTLGRYTLPTVDLLRIGFLL